MAVMNIDLSEDLEQLVSQKVQSGGYSSPTDVVRQALSLLEDRDEDLNHRRAEIDTRIRLSLAALERGEYSDGEEFFELLLKEIDLAEKP